MVFSSSLPISIVGLISSAGVFGRAFFFNNFLSAGERKMFRTQTRIGLFPAVAGVLLMAGLAQSEDSKTLPVVTLMRVPNRGIQPQVAVDSGRVHMIYFRGEPANGDIFYVRMDKG